MDLSKKRKSADELEHIVKRLNQQPENVIINISDDEEDDDYHVMSDEEYHKYLDDMKDVEYVVGGGDEEEIPSSSVAIEAQCVSVCDENEVEEDDEDYHVLSDEVDDDYHVRSYEEYNLDDFMKEYVVHCGDEEIPSSGGIAIEAQCVSVCDENEIKEDDEDYHVLSDEVDDDYHVRSDEEYNLDDFMREYIVGGGDEEIPISSGGIAIEAQCVSVCDENEVEEDDEDYHVLSGEDYDDYHVLSDEVDDDDDDYHVLSDSESVVGGQ